MKRLNDLIGEMTLKSIHGDPGREIRTICFDSRMAGPGDLFVALRGTVADGHRYIDTAHRQGAVGIVCESLPDALDPDCCYLECENSHEALGLLASAFYGHPSRQLKLTGVTGTNGKTSVVTLLHELFLRLGYGAGMISTIVNKVNQHQIPATHTTPDPVQLNGLLARMVSEGCEYCFMEVSSHAIDQKRISGLQFAGGIFTNLTHDHLDYHKTFRAYLEAKKAFFDQLPLGSFALVNIDDRNGKIMVQNCGAKVSTYSIRTMAEFRCRVMENGFHGLQLRMDGEELWVKMIGRFNASNLTAVYGTARLLGQEKMQVLSILSTMEPVNGRFNYIRTPDGITGIVDYAHTPDALKNVLETINEIRGNQGNLITVAGAGGNRDAAKRPVMAGIAAGLSNRVILTSDNPRNEDPNSILQQMKSGIDEDQSGRTLVIENRKEAIKTACALCKPGDIILIAGKGHETYQEINGVRYPFDDMQVLREALNTNQK